MRLLVYIEMVNRRPFLLTVFVNVCVLPIPFSFPEQFERIEECPFPFGSDNFRLKLRITCDAEKEIDYRLEEVVFDCDMAICFQPTKEKEIFEVMQEAVGVRNDLFAKAMNPAEPHNPSLVRKHYAALRAEMDDVFGKLFEKLSKINEQK